MVAVEPAYCHQCGSEATLREVHGRQRRWCPDCEFVMFRNAVPSAGVLVVDDERVLLIERAVPPDDGLWALPGGHPEYDEEPLHAAVRELREETGIVADPADLSLFTVVHAQTEHHGGRTYHYNMITYTVQRSATRGDVDLGPEAADASYWSVDDILENTEQTREIDRRRIRMVFDR